ncbi:hypothetical protein FG379_001567 [Cryptosporidium bovis]|uniref:uncharacterized protein n=1 Tax=Cryptosporidium bovis TaxID=310047 RepID=UPI00351A2FAC|nr:hypothetical protein FG379_001567 [Cryptosporidium bovis]
MSNNHNKSDKKTSIKIFILQVLWISYFVLLLISGVINLVLHYQLKRLVVNIFILSIGLISLLAEFYCFKFYSYMLFMYTPIGRGIFMTTLSCLSLDDNLASLVISVVLFINSLVYLIVSVLFGGINKPLFNSSLKHELDLVAYVYFINNASNNKKHKIRKSDAIDVHLLDNNNCANEYGGNKSNQNKKHTQNHNSHDSHNTNGHGGGNHSHHHKSSHGNHNNHSNASHDSHHHTNNSHGNNH